MENALKQHIVRLALANNISVYQAEKSSERFKLDFISQNGKDMGQPMTLDKDVSQ
jgi:hypothetical protein